VLSRSFQTRSILLCRTLASCARTSSTVISGKTCQIFVLAICAVTGQQIARADTCSTGGGCPSGFPNYTQPTNQTACTGGVARFSVAPADADQHAWQYSADGSSWSPLSDAGSYSGTSTSTLTISPSNAPEAGFYRCVVGCSVSGNQCTSNEPSLLLDTAPSVDSNGPYTTCGTTAVGISGTANDTAVIWTTSGTGSFGNANNLATTYTPSAADVLAGTVTLTLTVGCSPNTSASNATLTIDDPPTADAGGPYQTCGTTATSITGTATNAVSTTWSTSGTGDFDDASALDTTYTPSTADVAAGSITLTLTATNPGCTPSFSTSNATLTINSLSAGAGGPYASCGVAPVNVSGVASNATSTTWSSSGTGTFDDASALSTAYTPSADDVTSGSVTLTLTADNSACTPNSVQSNATLILGGITNDAGGPYSTCETESVNVSGTATNQSSVTWSTSGTGTFTNGNSLSAIYNPSADDLTAGSVTLTLTADNSSCNPTSATSNAALTLHSSPTASAGGPYGTCDIDGVALAGTATGQSGVSWSTSGSGTFTNGDTLSATYHPSVTDLAAGTVTLTLTADATAPCNTDATSQATLTLQRSPLVSAGNNHVICPGQSVVLGGAVSNQSSFEWSGGTGTFDPDDTTLNATYTPSAGEIASGSVILTLTAHPIAPCVVGATDTMLITINPLPDPSLALGATQTAVCSGSKSAVTVAASALGVNYQLRNNADNSTVGPAVSGTGGIISLPTSAIDGPTTFNVLAIDAATQCSQQLSATQTITLLPATQVTLQPVNASALIASGQTATATFSVLAQGLTLTYQWKLSTNGGLNYATIAGATASSYTTDALSLADNGNLYRCAIKGDCGSALSESAILAVHDSDGVDNSVEKGASNDGDGNADGIPDSMQANVTSLPDVNGEYVTLVSPPGTELVSVVSQGSPSPFDAPASASFPAGFLKFKVMGVGVGGATQVQVILPPGVTTNSYFKFGPEPGNLTPHWYEFMFDGTTGAQINGDVVMLFLVDGLRGDSDLTANGIIVDPGAPTFDRRNPACDNPVIAALSPICGLGCIVSMIGTFAGLLALRVRGRRHTRS
jgi:hypothetical protein